MVPRQWLRNINLECILYNKIKFHYHIHGEFENLVIKIERVKATLESHSNYLWARMEFDWATKPDKKFYLAVFFPCIFCSEPLFSGKIILIKYSRISLNTDGASKPISLAIIRRIDNLKTIDMSATPLHDLFDSFICTCIFNC